MAKRTAKEAVMDTAALDRWERLVKEAIGLLRDTGVGAKDRRGALANVLTMELGIEQERREIDSDN